MFASVGIPEVVVLLMMCVLWLLPIAAAIWALVTLHRVRVSQQAIQDRLGAIEQLLQRR